MTQIWNGACRVGALLVRLVFCGYFADSSRPWTQGIRRCICSYAKEAVMGEISEPAGEQSRG